VRGLSLTAALCPTHEPALDELAERVIVAVGVAPAAQVAVGVRTPSGVRVALGAAGRLPSGKRVDPTTIFDLASVTKPFVAVTAACLDLKSRPALTARLDDLLPELATQFAGAFTLEQLLSHRAGLEAHRTLFATLIARRALDHRGALRQAASACRSPLLGASTDTTPLYSDLGYLLVGEALERATGTALDQLVTHNVLEPLGLVAGSMRQLLAQESDVLTRIAPTEHVAWRGGMLRGIVHDENAWAIAGHGIGGHAGLFGTAEAVAKFGHAVLEALAGRMPSFLEATQMARLTAPRPGGSLRAGFDAKSSSESLAGSLAGPRTFGHLGFTGTSLWCDPDGEAVTVLLTNRVCPTRRNVAIRRARPIVHDALFAAAAACRSSGSWAFPDPELRPVEMLDQS
jgi:CubicO group peptidase (beta-lactamase class C family)